MASELSLAEARERREIASDLHDHIGQALAFVSQKLSLLRGNAVFSGMQAEFTEALSILNQTIKYTRDLTVQISPPVLYELGLPAAVEWLAERETERHGLSVSCTQIGTARTVTDDISVFVFKAVQELLTNAIKHTQAGQINIKTAWGNDHIEVTVSDNGQGFMPDAIDSQLSDNNCFGLFSIRERLSYIGGELDIESIINQGTTVTLSVPYLVNTEKP